MRRVERRHQLVDVRSISTTRSTLRRGASRSVTAAIDAEQPVAADRRGGTARRSPSRLQRRSSPSASTRSNDSTSPMIGRSVRPRPWHVGGERAAEASAGRRRSASGRCPTARGPRPGARPSSWSISSGHWMPASTVDEPALGVEARARGRSGRVSSSTAPSPNCWPPIACRPPAIATARPSPRRARTAPDHGLRTPTGTIGRPGLVEPGVDVVDQGHGLVILA